jgi:hypothetical protein
LPTPAADGRPAAPVVPAMRALLLVAAVLVLLAGVQLFVFPERTDRWFAWTIGEPLTATVLGAAYWSAVGFELLAARQQRWVDARIAVPAVWVFTTLTFVITLVHLEVFHTGSEHGAGTRAVTYAWIAVYAVVPVLLLVGTAVQLRACGADPPRRAPIPTLVTALVAVQAVVLLPVGVWLLLDPGSAADAWPWSLTPLTSRALGAWAVGLGIAAVHALGERDLHRLRPAAVAYVLFGALELVALARYSGSVAWERPGAAAVTAFFAASLVTGGAALLALRDTR